MELKFVSDETALAVRGRKAAHNWAPLIEEIYKHPNRWVEAPWKLTSGTEAYRLRSRFKDIEVSIQGGNNLSKNSPDKKLWTVYIRFVPSAQIIDELI